MDDVFKALADPTRRVLLDRLRERSGQTLGELCADLGMARQSVSKHLAVLEAAGVVTVRWRGREKLHHLDAVPINDIAERWLSRYDRRRAEALADLRTALEGARPMDDFVYTTYIRTTAEQLWQALTEPAFTRRYWGVELTSDWTVGSPVSWRFAGATMAEPEQVVLVSEPPHRLSYTWHAITEEFGRAIEADPAELAELAAEPLSQVTFEIEERGEMVRLTVTHGGFADGSRLREGIGVGWPEILSSLKSLLETGEPLPA